MSDKALSIITNFGCHYKCPECIVKNNHIDVPKTTLDGLDKLSDAFIKNNCELITISGGGDPLYQYDKNVEWYRKLFRIMPEISKRKGRTIDVEMHTSYLTDQTSFSFYDCCRVVYHAHTIYDLPHIYRTGKEIVRIVFVVTPDYTIENLLDIANYVKNSSDIDELSFRQYVDVDYNAVSHLEPYLKLGHQKLWYYIEQNDYNLYYAENQIYTSYRDFQNTSRIPMDDGKLKQEV